MTTAEKATHTSGPWEVDADRFWIRSAITQSIVATVEKDLHFHGEQQANGDLIAAAPEMLEALEDLTAQLWHDGPRDGSEEAWKRIKSNALAAIRKAKGEAA